MLTPTMSIAEMSVRSIILTKIALVLTDITPFSTSDDINLTVINLMAVAIINRKAISSNS